MSEPLDKAGALGCLYLLLAPVVLGLFAAGYGPTLFGWLMVGAGILVVLITVAELIG